MSKEMTFWEHLEELRGVIFRSLIAIVILMVVVFLGKSILFDQIIFAPISSDFFLYRWIDTLLSLIGMGKIEPFSLQLVNIDLAAQFFTHVKISFYVALIVSTPYIFYLLWGFIKPALYPKEKRKTKAAFGLASILFFIGVLVGYGLIFPFTLRFLGTYQVSAAVPNQISLQSYISMFSGLILVMGVVFEMPALAMLLSKLGIINREMLQKYRKHAFVVLLIAAAVITPSGDAFTLMLVTIPLYMLYEISIRLTKRKEVENDSDQ